MLGFMHGLFVMPQNSILKDICTTIAAQHHTLYTTCMPALCTLK